MKKVCTKCNKEKDLFNFRTCKYPNGKLYSKSHCKNCEVKNSTKWQQENIENFKKTQNNWRKTHPTYLAQWKIKNKKSINYKYKQRLKIDPAFKLRKTLSKAINRAIKINGSVKAGSILSYLPYKIEELKIHLESKFEPWMTWNNWGLYNAKTWNDNDSSTWTWQIDHIVPQSKFCFKDMSDPEFIKCWDLINIRPYSAKLNSIEGSKKVRHK